MKLPRALGRSLPLLLPLLAALAGCGEGGRGSHPSAAPASPAGVAAPAAAPASPVAAAVPRRIVALTPSLVETLFELGLGDRVVGVGDYSTWPPAVKKKPRLGGLFDPNLERIVSLRPDLAILVPSERDLGARLERLGTGVLIVPSESLADVERAFLTVARRCGVPAAGERLAARFRADLAPVAAPASPPLKVLLSVGRQGGRLSDITVAGPGTFVDELLRRTGAVNAFADSKLLWPQVGIEDLVARAPDVILELSSDPIPENVATTLRNDWRQLANLPAVRNGRIQVIAADYVLIPGPRLPLLYRELQRAVSPAGAMPPPGRKPAP